MARKITVLPATEATSAIALEFTSRESGDERSYYRGSIWMKFKRKWVLAGEFSKIDDNPLELQPVLTDVTDYMAQRAVAAHACDGIEPPAVPQEAFMRYALQIGYATKCKAESFAFEDWVPFWYFRELYGGLFHDDLGLDQQTAYCGAVVKLESAVAA